MEKKKRIVVLTGAGISAESGLSTFRDADGLWENHPVAEVATHEALERNPKAVYDFANMLRRNLQKAEPNPGHLLLAELEKDYDVVILTQNIDDLHERAGSKSVLHLHGELMKACTIDRPDRPIPLPGGRLDINPGDTDGEGRPLRPFIVYFGEDVPNYTRAMKETEKADLFVVIGSSLNVYPVAGLLYYVPDGVPCFVIDPKPVQTPYRTFRQIQKGASEGMAELRAKLEAGEII